MLLRLYIILCQHTKLYQQLQETIALQCGGTKQHFAELFLVAARHQRHRNQEQQLAGSATLWLFINLLGHISIEMRSANEMRSKRKKRIVMHI